MRSQNTQLEMGSYFSFALLDELRARNLHDDWSGNILHVDRPQCSRR